MRHHITKEHPFEGLTSGVIECSFLYSYIKAYRLSASPISVYKMKAKNLHWIKKWHPRYRAADLEFPCIVVKQEESYRVIDGRHRLRLSLIHI